ncbi:hypothetical protein CBE89_09240 [Corynebacterium striatum]|uniref:DUF1648 domain-containing protein n=1 Tax=Corynebacterium striatum TaxID=43770 RepID=A0A2Z2IZK1_CORST|nr:hypothetical protein CBE89_09240 [Corynebacterium striatum]
MLTAPRKEWIWLAATAALAIVAAIVVIAGWDSLPDPLPKHFNGRGEPDAWMPKTYRNAIGFAVLVPIILTIVSAVTIGITQQSTKTTTGSYSQSTEIDIECSRAHAAAALPTLSFWFFALTAICTTFALTGIFLSGPRPLVFPCLAVAILVLCVWLVFRLKSINRKLDEQFPGSSTAGKLRYGLFYYDPTDTRAMVTLPNGSAQLNFGQKTAWFILAGLLVPPVLIIILLNVAT